MLILKKNFWLIQNFFLFLQNLIDSTDNSLVLKVAAIPIYDWMTHIESNLKWNETFIMYN